MNTTLRVWFDDFSERTGEKPESIVFQPDMYGWEDIEIPSGVVGWSDVPSDILDREFDDGYGGEESPNLCAWSPSWVIFSDVYDGAESLQWVPRNPLDHTPIRPGGG